MSSPATTSSSAVAAASSSSGSSSKRSRPISSPRDSTAIPSWRRIRPRHFHTGPNLSMEARASAAGSSSSNDSTFMYESPAARLYSHALESVFSMLGLKDLSVIMTVSKSWKRAVASMASLRSEVPWNCNASIDTLCRSGLARHIGSWNQTMMISQADGEPTLPLNVNLMNMIARAITNLEDLDYEYDTNIVGSSNVMMSFPPKLRSLCLSILPEPSAADDLALQTAHLHRMFLNLSRLTDLQELTLWLPQLDPLLRFRALAACPRLLDLRIHSNRIPGTLQLSDEQIIDLQSLYRLREMHLQGLDAVCFKRLLLCNNSNGSSSSSPSLVSQGHEFPLEFPLQHVDSTAAAAATLHFFTAHWNEWHSIRCIFFLPHLNYRYPFDH